MPSSSFTVTIEGVEELLARMRAGDGMAESLLVKAMADATDDVKRDAQVYPPETEANQPPPPYYIRGQGTQYANGNRGESQQLKDNWQTEVNVSGKGVLGKIFNSVVTYAPWVHGVAWQRRFHKARGWRNIRQITDENLNKVESRFSQAAQKLAAFLNGGSKV